MIKLVLLVIYIVLLHKHSCSFKNKSRSMHYKLLWTAFEFRYNCYSKSNLNKLWVWIHLHLLISEFLFKETYKYRSLQEISQNVWNVQDKQMPQGIVGSSTWSTRRQWQRLLNRLVRSGDGWLHLRKELCVRLCYGDSRRCAEVKYISGRKHIATVYRHKKHI